MTASHALDTARLPTYHADPFDRMLIAQAVAENLTLSPSRPLALSVSSTTAQRHDHLAVADDDGARRPRTWSLTQRADSQSVTRRHVVDVRLSRARRSARIRRSSTILS
ncbi:MAG: hypothetical protein M0Z42_00705 [Actinomycetota bacterium]|jgi:hypothetical protein|nr:hypothetical protein [Actinomycetota bacterium]